MKTITFGTRGYEEATDKRGFNKSTSIKKGDGFEGMDSEGVYNFDIDENDKVTGKKVEGGAKVGQCLHADSRFVERKI